MDKKCKNCSESICSKRAGKKVYFCLMNPIPEKCQRVYMSKYKQVDANGYCKDYEPRDKGELFHGN